MLEESGVDVLGIASSGEHVLSLVRLGVPDVVLVCLWVGSILDQWPNVRGLALAALGDPASFAEAGKVGFEVRATKESPASQLLTPIKAAAGAHGVRPYRFLAESMDPSRAERSTTGSLATQLTRRERQVLASLIQGASNKEMSRRLSLKPSTVRTHVRNLLEKLEVHSRLEAVTLAIRHGLVSSEFLAPTAEGPRFALLRPNSR